MQAWLLVTRTNQTPESDAGAKVIAGSSGVRARLSDALGQTHTCRGCGEPIRDRDYRAILCLDCLRRRKNARGHAYNKANRERLNDYRPEWRRRRRERVVS